ncbi:hypothetical protein Agub_g7832 [Astrephomene gubernaculifera]|uniref:guanylate cyclase n=1 Tax=Astrephomene gubernaculifera TaxID=47775 RepID=A0AAD3HMM8_9CHLO|nr:hypothetical protein Agub_g7832 [Astrephomene gubernaculifera]
MIGWINLSVEAFICDSFGRDAWQRIVQEARVDCNWVSSCPYPDKITYDLVITGAGILGVTVPQALEAYGQYFVNYVIKQGYTRLMKSLGSNIAEFLANLNNLHLHLTMGFPSMVAPAFRVEQVTSNSLLLHYHSMRPALWPIVSGVLKGAAQVLFEHAVELQLVASREAGDCDHEIFRVTYPHQESLTLWDNHDAALASEYSMTKDFFFEMFPFHVILDPDCRVVQAGSVMTRLFGSTLTHGSAITDTFTLRHPHIPFEYDRMLLESDSLFLLKAFQTGLEFKGQMVKTNMPDGRPVLLFLGSPRVATLEEMGAHGLFLSDIPLHDMSRDFVLLAEQRQAEADLKERFEKMAVELRVANERLEQATSWLAEERSRSDALLYRMLPADIAADLREGRKVEAINYPEVTILFSDMVGFTNTSAKSTAEEVYNMLNEMYDKFDCLIDEFPDVYKLETIGDAYFLVCNLTTHCPRHVDTVIDFAIRMQAAARGVRDAQGQPVQIRIGIHTGPVVGGVLGAKTPRFSVYGDTVNVASRMESHGLPGKIHISAAAYARIVDKHKYAVRERGNIAVKGRGNMTTYLIGGTHDDWLLRQSFTDVQMDGVGGVAGRDGSFVVTASGRSADSMAAYRPQTAMEAIKEGDEDRLSRSLPPHGFVSGTTATNSFTSNPAGDSSAALTGTNLPTSSTGMVQTGATVVSVDTSAATVAAAGAAVPSIRKCPFQHGSFPNPYNDSAASSVNNSGNVAMATLTPSMSLAAVAAAGATPVSADAAAATATSTQSNADYLASGGVAAISGGGSGGGRHLASNQRAGTGDILSYISAANAAAAAAQPSSPRSGSVAVVAAAAASSGSFREAAREASFRAVYARGGRPASRSMLHGSPSAAASGHSLLAAASGSVEGTTTTAAAPVSGGFEKSSYDNVAPASSVAAAAAGGTSFVIARGATSKSSLPFQQGTAAAVVVAAAAAAPPPPVLEAPAVTAVEKPTVAAKDAPTPAQAQALPPPPPSPMQAAVLQQLQAASLYDTSVRRNGSTAGNSRVSDPSSGAGDVSPSTANKPKGLASKLKNFFKK